MDIFNLPIHPAADVFPMLDTDELSDLASDIQANGLQHPIVVGVVDGVEMLIDGRNRLAACKLANVEPEIKQLNGQDPRALIMSENVMRRHNTKGQIAMCVALMYPEATANKQAGQSLEIKQWGVNKVYLSQARTVVQFAPEYCDTIVAGAKSLSEAYEEAKHRKSAGNDDTEKLDWLKSVSPELADKVVEGERTLPGAIADYHEYERIAKQDRYGYWQIFRQLETYGRVFNEDSIGEIADNYRDFSNESGVDMAEIIDTYINALSKLKERI